MVGVLPTKSYKYKNQITLKKSDNRDCNFVWISISCSLQMVGGDTDHGGRRQQQGKYRKEHEVNAIPIVIGTQRINFVSFAQILALFAIQF